MKKTTLLVLSSAVLAWFAGPALAEDSAETWARQCQKCHAEDGSGDTKMGKKLDLKDFRDPAVQAAVSDEEIIRITKEGVVDDKGKQTMKAYADVLTEEQILGMVTLIRGFAKE